MAGWHDPRPTDHRNPVEAQRWRSLEAFLHDPTFSSINLQDDTQRVYNPSTGVIIPAPVVPILGGGGGTAGPTGPTGPAGPQGPPGPAGPAGGSAGTISYRHVQASAATTWTIVHNLPFMPSVIVVDSTGREVIPGAVDYTNATTVALTFSAAFGGEAYLS